MKMIMPICRAKKIDSDYYVVGYYNKVNNLERLMDSNAKPFRVCSIYK